MIIARKILKLLISALIISNSLYCVAAPMFDGVKTKWRFQTQGAIRSDAVVGDEEIFVTSTDGRLYALNKYDGKKLWQLNTNGALVGEPALSPHIVVAVSRDNHVYAVKRKNGKVKWTFRMKKEKEIPKSGWKYFSAAPKIARNKVYIGSGDSHLYALDLDSGKLNWKFRTNGQIRATPLIHQGKIYQPSNDGIIYILDAASGELEWTFKTEGHNYNPNAFNFDRKSIYTTPIISGKSLIVGSRDGKVYAIDIDTHTLRWKASYGTTWAMSTAFDDTTVYVGWSTNDLLSATDIGNGEEKWTFKAGAHSYTSALITERSLYFGSADGYVYQLDKTNGTEIWRYSIGSEIYSSPVYDEDTNTLFVGSDDGSLYALEEHKEVHKVVYQPEGITDLTQYLIVDANLTPALVEKGYEHLDSAEALMNFIESRNADGSLSVIVFALPIIPNDVLGNDPSNGMMRKYLDLGGKVVWFGIPPNYLSLNQSGDGFERDAATGSKLLDVKFGNLSESGSYYNKSTQEGRNWGLPNWLTASGTPVLQKNGVEALAKDEFGRITIWHKPFSDRIGTGYVSLRPWAWNVDIKDKDIELIDAIATYGIR